MTSNIRFERNDVEFLTERPSADPRRARSSSSCTLGNSPEPEEVVADPFSAEVIDLTDEAHDFSRYGLLDDDEYAVEQLPIGGFFAKPGMFLEINDTLFLGKYRIDFILVRVIACNETTGPKIRGVPYARTRNLLCKLPKKANEVCLILYYNSSDPRIKSEGLVDVSPSVIVQKRTLITTNALYPQHCCDVAKFRHIADGEERDRALKQFGSLTCR